MLGLVTLMSYLKVSGSRFSIIMGCLIHISKKKKIKRVLFSGNFHAHSTFCHERFRYSCPTVALWYIPHCSHETPCLHSSIPIMAGLCGTLSRNARHCRQGELRRPGHVPAHGPANVAPWERSRSDNTGHMPPAAI